jgi:hypothetical protein
MSVGQMLRDALGDHAMNREAAALPPAALKTDLSAEPAGRPSAVSTMVLDEGRGGWAPPGSGKRTKARGERRTGPGMRFLDLEGMEWISLHMGFGQERPA